MLAPVFARAASVELPDPDLPEAPEAAPANLKSLLEPEQIHPERKAKYHWKGLLVQSLEFNLIENGFRLRPMTRCAFSSCTSPSGMIMWRP
jgi:hypothetical protein